MMDFIRRKNCPKWKASDMYSSIIKLSVILILSTSNFCKGSETERKLVYDLIELPGYNPLIRPVQNVSESIKVQFGITLFQVISVDERTQVMKTNNWIRMMWNDYQLIWDPNKYDGIQAIRLPCEQVWKPDIVLLNNADGKYEQSYCCHTVLYNTGMVLWIPLAIYKSSCTIDVRYFPFDDQECEMKFGSWTFSRNEVQMDFLDNRDICDLSNYVFSGTWDLTDCPAVIAFDKKYSEIKYTIKLRRKTLFFTVNLLTPCVLISFLSVLTFYLPANAQEKITLCISILLALVVFLLLVSRSLPPTSVTIPLISKYLFFAFIMNIITIVVSVMIININYSSPRTYKMPRLMRIIFLNWLPIIMFMQRPKHQEKYLRWRERKLAAKIATCERRLKTPNTNSLGALNTPNQHDVKETKFSSETTGYSADEKMIYPESSVGNGGSESISNRGTLDGRNISGGSESAMPITMKAKKAAESVVYITQHLRMKDDYEEICEDWKYVASVIDRFLLYLFLGITISGTISIIVDAPHIFEVVDQQQIVDNLQAGST